MESKKTEDQKVTKAFKQVFGKKGERTPEQALVWETLESVGYYNRPTYQGDINASNIAEGRRTLFLAIKSIVEQPLNKPKPLVRK